MQSIRALFLAADVARAALKDTYARLADRNSPEARHAYMMASEAKAEAEAAVYDATLDLDHAAMDYRRTGDATTAQYDALIAAALQAHATDTEAASE